MTNTTTNNKTEIMTLKDIAEAYNLTELKAVLESKAGYEPFEAPRISPINSYPKPNVEEEDVAYDNWGQAKSSAKAEGKTINNWIKDNCGHKTVFTWAQLGYIDTETYFELEPNLI